MKYVLIVLLSSITFSSYAKRTIISGHYNYKPEEKSYIQFYGSTIDFIDRIKTRLTATPNKNSNFKFVFDTDIPLNYNFYNGDKLVFYNKYVGPGDSLHFIFSNDQISVEGNCEECVAFQFAQQEKFFSGSALDEYHKSFKNYEPLAFAEFQNKLRIAQRDYFESYFKDKPCPPLFRQELLNGIDYNFAVDMAQSWFRAKNAKKALNDSAFFSYFSNIKIDNADALINGRYVHFIHQLPQGLWAAYRENFSGDSVQYEDILNKQVFIQDSFARIYFTGAQYDYALYAILKGQIDFVPTVMGYGDRNFGPYYRKSDSILTVLQKQFQNKSLYDSLRHKLESYLLPPQPAPDFAAKDLNGKTVKLSDLKGKFVYVDFWSTTCAPCVAALPHNKKMQEKYKDNKDVVLLYVSFDGDKNKLEQFLKSKNFTGLHWMDGRGFASDAAQAYHISGIPRYIVIDKEGLLVSDNAVGAEHGDLLIDKLLAGDTSYKHKADLAKKSSGVSCPPMKDK